MIRKLGNETKIAIFTDIYQHICFPFIEICWRGRICDVYIGEVSIPSAYTLGEISV